MNCKVFVITFIIFFSARLNAQYYYRDIVTNRQTSAEFDVYKKAGVRTIKTRSIDPDGQESKDFFCEKRINRDFTQSSLYTRTAGTGKSLMESYFDKNGNLVRTYDTSATVARSSYYYYDQDNRLIKIFSKSQSNDDDFITSLEEEHLYYYDDKSLPTKMIRIKNRKDSCLFLFYPDENNNVGIEKDTKSGAKYYYYYDKDRRLTDVVHTSEYKQKMIADYIFEYNAENQLTQMTTTEEGEKNYFVWLYEYENGLRKNERIYSKENRLIGQIEYEYKK